MFKSLLIVVVLIVGIFAVQTSTFVLQEDQQAIIIQLGKAQEETITKSGLHLLIPFLQEVRFLDKRILSWDGQRGEIPSRDKKFIWVDTTARWRIKDALKFYKTVRDNQNALSKMSAVINGVTKDTISNYNLIETVRNSNKILEDIQENLHEAEKLLAQDSSDTTLEELVTDVEQIQFGREKLSQIIAERSREELVSFGIELLDVQLRSIAYKEVVEQKVYNRMISERMKIATKIRSSGRGEEAKVLGQLDLALKKIESEAYRKSQEIRGKAEAEAMRIFSQNLKEDPEYFAFVKNLDVYKKTLANRSEIILSTDSAFLQLLNKGDEVIKK